MDRSGEMNAHEFVSGATVISWLFFGLRKISEKSLFLPFSKSEIYF